MHGPAAVRAIVEAAGAVPVQVGGGLREVEHIRAMLDLGVRRVILGTRALRDPAWTEQVVRDHPGRVVLGLDARDGLVAVQGWLETDTVTVAEVLAMTQYFPINLAQKMKTQIDQAIKVEVRKRAAA